MTHSLDAQEVRAFRMAAARRGLLDQQVVVEAQRNQLGVGALESLLKSSPVFSKDQASTAAKEELQAYRAGHP